MTLPATWQTASIGELLLDVEKGEPSAWHEESFFYVDIASIDSLAMKVSSPSEIRVDEAPSRARQHLQAGDVVFSTVRPYLKNIGLIEEWLDGQVASTGFCVLRADEDVSYKYLYYFVIRDDFIERLKPLQRGTSYPAVRDADVKSIPIPLPPANEQRRIVAKIEALFSEIEHGVEELKAAQQKLKRARQALLKAAFEGKLTARWRTENPDKLESPEVLRQRIQTEREAYHRRQLEEWEKAVEEWKADGSEGKKPRKPRFSKPLLLSKEEIHDLPELPRGWLWERYGNLCSLVRNGISKKPSSGQGLKVFRISAVRPMRLDLSDYRYFDDVEQYEDYVLTSGDLLFTRYNGSRYYVGVSAVFRSDDRYVFPDKLVQTRLLSGYMSPEYYQYATNSGGSRRFIESMIRTTAGQSGVSGADIKSMPVPVCSKNEQVKIVEALESRLSEIDQMGDVLQASLQRAESLKQSILKRAFSGRLVPQDPDDEPASELLARIRAEREVEQAAAPRRRRGKKAEATS